MTNADLPAFPQPEQHDAGKFTGVSKREHFAALAMQGLLDNPEIAYCDTIKWADMAKDAVAAADALLSELEKTKSKP